MNYNNYMLLCSIYVLLFDKCYALYLNILLFNMCYNFHMFKITCASVIMMYSVHQNTYTKIEATCEQNER